MRKIKKNVVLKKLKLKPLLLQKQYIPKNKNSTKLKFRSINCLINLYKLLFYRQIHQHFYKFNQPHIDQNNLGKVLS